MTERIAKSMPVKKTFTDYLRLWFKWFLDPLGGFFNRLGITPNMMTMLGLLGNTVGAYYLARGEMFLDHRRIPDRHIPAGERDHLGAHGFVRIV